MSTHSTISVEMPDGSVRGIYCHFDGYPGHMFPALRATGHMGISSIIGACVDLDIPLVVHRVITHIDIGGTVQVDVNTFPSLGTVHRSWPPVFDDGQHYCYLVRPDGSVEGLRFNGSNCTPDWLDGSKY